MPDGLGETLVAVIRTARHPSEIPSAMRRPTVDSRRTSARLAKMAGEAWLNLRQRQTGCESSRHALGRGCHSTGRSEAGQTPVAQQTGGGAVAPRGMTGIRPSHRVNVSEEIERSCRCFCRRATGVCRHPAGAGTPFALLHTRRDDRARKVSESRGTGYGDEELRRVLLTTRGGASYLDPSWGERRGWRACCTSLTLPFFFEVCLYACLLRSTHAVEAVVVCRQGCRLAESLLQYSRRRALPRQARRPSDSSESLRPTRGRPGGIVGVQPGAYGCGAWAICDVLARLLACLLRSTRLPAGWSAGPRRMVASFTAPRVAHRLERAVRRCASSCSVGNSRHSSPEVLAQRATD
jgi:hypothetical protein